jgi:hypothetical protein
MRNLGIGQEVIRFLQFKGLPMQLVVANENLGMLKLLDKFKTDSVVGENAQFVWIRH